MLHDAFKIALREADTPDKARALARTLAEMAELAHPGPWRMYLADVCGVETVPDDWRAAMGPYVQIAWSAMN